MSPHCDAFGPTLSQLSVRDCPLLNVIISCTPTAAKYKTIFEEMEEELQVEAELNGT